MVNRKIEISKEEICMYLHVPITEASAKLGISISVLKKRCRDFGIRRWPYRKIKSYEKKVSNLERNLLRNPEKSFEITTQIQRFSRKRQAAISHPESISSQGLESDFNGFALLESGTEIEDSNFFNKIHQCRSDHAPSIRYKDDKIQKYSDDSSSILRSENDNLSDVELLLSLSSTAAAAAGKSNNGSFSGTNSGSVSPKVNESHNESDNEMIMGSENIHFGMDYNDGDVVVLPPCSSFDMIPPAFIL